MTPRDRAIEIARKHNLSGSGMTEYSYDAIIAAIMEALAQTNIAVRALKLIEHATAPGSDDAYHENAYSLAHRALSDLKWGTVDGASQPAPAAEAVAADDAVPCTHDIAERETACVDGMCPICSADRIAQLAAERDELMHDLKQYVEGRVNQITNEQLRSRAEKAEAAAEADRRDAERYRCARDSARIGQHGEWIVLPEDAHEDESIKRKFDADLDAELGIAASAKESQA